MHGDCVSGKSRDYKACDNADENAANAVEKAIERQESSHFCDKRGKSC